jgi:UDP-N-acetyl-D-mannosaminuronate dehydrogenase
VEEVVNLVKRIVHLKKNRNIVVGLGYVGLTLALSLAQSGRKVFGYDYNSDNIDQALKLCEKYPNVKFELKDCINEKWEFETIY